MKIIRLIKKNNYLFFVLKNIQRLIKKIFQKLFIFTGIDERLSKIERSLIYEYSSESFKWEKNCLNGQKFRKKIITEILSKINFISIVETGTEYGFTTKYFSQFCKKIISIEKSKPIYLIAKKNLINDSNIKLVLNDSKNLDKILGNENIDLKNDNNTFFYLDAHSDDDYPLHDEIKYIIENYKNFILIIDDFQIPGDDGYGYDSYRGKKLNINFIKNLLSEKEYVFFPKVKSNDETGRTRGYIIITNNYDFKNILLGIQELKEHSN